MMVSFDVASLFTNVPIDEAVSVIRDKLQNDENLDERTCLSPECITELLEVCLRSTYFRYNRNCYEQVDGAAMGILLFPQLWPTCWNSLRKKL